MFLFVCFCLFVCLFVCWFVRPFVFLFVFLRLLLIGCLFVVVCLFIAYGWLRSRLAIRIKRCLSTGTTNMTLLAGSCAALDWKFGSNTAVVTLVTVYTPRSGDVRISIHDTSKIINYSVVIVIIIIVIHMVIIVIIIVTSIHDASKMQTSSKL